MTARAFALFVALLTMMNLLGDLLWPGFDASLWWISFGILPAWLSKSLLGASALALLRFACRRPVSGRRSLFVAASALTLALAAAMNVITFYHLLATDRITAGFPVPLSSLICVGMLWVAHKAWGRRTERRRLITWRVVAGCLGLFAMFPLAQMLFFGNTDYRRPADAVVVFGARAYKDGRLSDALEDRVRTACELYRKGLARRIVMSGGPGDGAIHETEAMRRYAIEHGVRDEDIVVDQHGLNTRATVRNTVPLFRQWQADRVLAVSHFYHLPRIKLSYQRAGFEVCTVPARQKYFLSQIPYSMAREVAAFWTYYARQKPSHPARA
ncbi:MAG: YdcF family protein [Verrucomicrobia bacterium]|nr:YdcF family protein [Verrucomicrobiota bacterium]